MEKGTGRPRILTSLLKGMRALDCLVEQGGPARLSDIACKIGISKSATSHILRTLTAAGYARQDASRKYLPGAKVGRRPTFSGTLSVDEMVALRDNLRPLITRLGKETNECVHTAVLAGGETLYIDKIDSMLPLRVDHPVGTTAPLHSTALGKAFLAFGSVEAPGSLPASTGKTITDPAKLRAELDTTRKRGYSIDDEEYSAGIRCVAAAVLHSRRGMVAAVGLSGPTARIGRARLRSLGTKLRRVCADHALAQVNSATL